MRKILSIILVLSILLSCAAATAEIGIQIISDESESISFDDIKPNVSVELYDNALINMTAFEWVDQLWSYPKDRHDGYLCFPINSGSEQEHAIVRMDIVNLTLANKNFLAEAQVQAVFDDKYVYSGWMYQNNYDYGTEGNSNPQWNVIDPSENFSIGPMYTGHYAFGCTLPNAVVNSKKPLRMEITIDGNEIIYNIRK